MSTDAPIRSPLTTLAGVGRPDRALAERSTSETESDATQRFARRDWEIFALLALLTFALFARAGRFDFIGYDDSLYITSNPHLAAGLTWPSIRWALTDTYECNWIPLTLLVQLAAASLFGVNATAFHLLNVLLHA